MRVEYPDIDLFWTDAMKATLDHGFEFESRVGKCKELIGISFTLTDIKKNFLANKARKLSPEYAAGELFWYLSQTDDGEQISAYAPSYKNFLNNGKANGAYGERWKNNPGFRTAADYKFTKANDASQLDVALSILKKDPNSRQCVITMWDSKDLMSAHDKTYNDVPCTLTMQFIVRDGKLNAIVNMRSNDLWLGLPYDVFCFTTIQRIMADALGLDYGWYTHNVGSFHVYEKNYVDVDVEQLIDYGDDDCLTQEEATGLLSGASHFLNKETLIRTGAITEVYKSAPGSYMSELLTCISRKFLGDKGGTVCNPLLNKMLKENR